LSKDVHVFTFLQAHSLPLILFDFEVDLVSCYRPYLFKWVSCCSMFCRSLFVLLSFYFWPLYCLPFFALQVLITPLVTSNFTHILRIV